LNTSFFSVGRFHVIEASSTYHMAAALFECLPVALHGFAIAASQSLGACRQW